MSGPGIQDTIRPIINIRINPGRVLPDSIFRRLDEKPSFLKNIDSGKIGRNRQNIFAKDLIIKDTTSVCSRNTVRDVTFYDNGSFISGLENKHSVPPLPFKVIEKPPPAGHNLEATITAGLKEGIIIPHKTLHNDWLIGIILLTTCLYLLVRSSIKGILPEISKYFQFSPAKESYHRDTGSIFTLRSTILNLISFTILGLFTFCAGVWYGIIPEGSSAILFILLSIGIISFGITSRHFICLATGSLSGEADLFRDYLLSVYQSYRFSSFIIFLFVILIIYTKFLSPDIYFISGLIVFGIFYLQRVLKLLLIFIKKDISILYLILYLCALEILPVLILLKYFSRHN
jgi:hypothetical protein